VFAWYQAVIDKFAGRPIGDDRFAFWRNELAAWLGTVTISARAMEGKGNSTIAAARRVAASFKGMPPPKFALPVGARRRLQ
jgi:hypothetical protein